MKSTQIDLHIETLVLRNLPYAQRNRIAEAIEQELTRLLTEYGLPPTLAHGGNIPQVDIDALPIAENARPSAMGARIAQSIYRTLSRNAQAVPVENSNVSRRKE